MDKPVIVKVRYLKSMAYAAYVGRRKVAEKYDLADLKATVKETYPICTFVRYNQQPK